MARVRLFLGRRPPTSRPLPLLLDAAPEALPTSCYPPMLVLRHHAGRHGDKERLKNPVTHERRMVRVPSGAWPHTLPIKADWSLVKRPLMDQSERPSHQSSHAADGAAHSDWRRPTYGTICEGPLLQCDCDLGPGSGPCIRDLVLVDFPLRPPRRQPFLYSFAIIGGRFLKQQFHSPSRIDGSLRALTVFV